MSQAFRKPTFDREELLDRLGGDEELLSEVLGMFRDECSKMLESMREAVRSRDATRIERAAHGLRGALLSVAAQAAADLVNELEQAGRSGTIEGCPAMLERFESALVLLDREFTAQIAPAGSPLRYG